MSGFIAMQRDALDHPVLHDAERFRAWFWLVANAAWRPTRTRVAGKIVTLERSELTYSVRFLAEAWGWSKSRVDRFLAELRAEGMIAARSKIGTEAGRRAGHAQSIITICNFDKYQSAADGSRDRSEPESGTAAGQQRDKEEQGNKGTKDSPPVVPPAKKSVGKRLPENWEPVLSAASQRIVDGWPPGKFERQLQRFRDHAADKGRLSKDWNAAFRNWISKDFPVNDRPSQPPRDNRDGFTRAIDDELARHADARRAAQAAG